MKFIVGVIAATIGLATLHGIDTNNAYAAAITNCAGCHDYGQPISTYADGSSRNVPTGDFPGSHNTHVTQYNFQCSDCHVVPSSTSTINNAHANQLIEMASPIHSNAGAFYKSLTTTSWARTNSPTFNTCKNTYCHSDGTSLATGIIATNSSPLWGTVASGCNTCHGVGGAVDGRPFYVSGTPKMNDHQAATHLSKTCDTCHSSVTWLGSTSYSPVTTLHNNQTSPYNINASMGYIFTTTGGTCSTSGCHGPGKWGVTQFNCVTCHSSTINITKGLMASTGNQRRAVSVEFFTSIGGGPNVWGHARSQNLGSIGAMSPAVCVVCHMEGDPSNASPMSSYHGNGYVELRDPDTGLTIENVVWVQSTVSQGGGWYTATGTPMNTMWAFRRNLASASLEPEIASTQINFCLKCHDGNGAMSTLARLGTTNRSTVAALRPFNVTILSTAGGTAMSSLGNMINGSGNVVNVVKHLLTSNASYHPILGKQNNSFIRGNLLLPPWNSIVKTQGITTVGQYGNLISCWDCHGAPEYAWNTNGTGQLMTYSVTAHGHDTTLRSGSAPMGSIAYGLVATTNLCLNCHRTQYASSNGNHAAVNAYGTSAFGGGGSTNMNTGTFGNCSHCHWGYAIGAQANHTSLAHAAPRPLRAENAHGYNERTPNVAGSTWASGNRPYNFIRNSLTNLSYSKTPERTTAVTGSCAGSGGTCNNNMGGDTYNPGGVF